MRTHLFRGACAVAVVLTLAASAFAQSVVRGKVQDAQGKPVDGATIVFEAEGTNRKMQTKTDNKGEFLQVGLQSGGYQVTASKDGVGTATSKANVRQGPNNPLYVHARSRRCGGHAGGQGGGAEAAGAGGRGDGGAARRQQRRGDREVQRSDHADADLRGLLLQPRRRAGQQEGLRGAPRRRTRRRSSSSPRTATPTPVWPRSTTSRRSSTSPPRRAPTRRSTRRPAAAATPRPLTTRA